MTVPPEISTMILTSLSALILMVAIRVILWKWGVAPLLKFLSFTILFSATIIPTLILYLAKNINLPWILVLDPPLFYDLAYASGSIDLMTASVGILTFALVILIISLYYLLPVPCIGNPEQIKACITQMYSRPSWILSIPISFTTTVALGLGTPHVVIDLFKLNPLYVVIPIIIVLISVAISIKLSYRIIPVEEGHEGKKEVNA